jgi:hypothetical protein
MSLSELEVATTQNNPNMFFGNADLNPPLTGRRGPFPVGEGGGLASIIQPGLLTSLGPILNRPPGFGISPMPVKPMPPFLGVQPPMQLPQMPDYSSQFEKIGEQLGGFGKQLDALGSFNEQVGGLGKQFEAVNNKLDSLEKGLGSLGNQLASIEQGQPKPQEVQRPTFNPFGSPFGFGLGSLFMRGY